MRAAVSVEPDSLELRDVPTPTLEPDDVLVKIHYAGICGTDLHVFHGTSANVHYPVIQGHEFAGEVVALGSGVQTVPIGARVVGEGRAGTGFRRDGAFAEYLSIPKEMLHILPSGIEMLEATLVDPLACAVHAVHRAQLSASDHLVIIGQGSSGLCMLQAARALVGCPIAVVDRREERLALSRRFGAELAVSSATDARVALTEWADPSAIDCVIDATGNAEAIDLALGLVRRDGRVVVYGVFGSRIDFDIDQVVYKQIEMRGAVGSQGCWPQAIDLLEHRQVDLEPIITRTVPLALVGDALGELADGSRDIKVVVQP
jgi:2-desacetyl-2-hydroxyethyl bacteriochlorophyllide A dehydrogenase